MSIKTKKVFGAILFAILNLSNTSSASDYNEDGNFTLLNNSFNQIDIPSFDAGEVKKPILHLKFTPEELEKLGGHNSPSYNAITKNALDRVGQEDYYQIMQTFCGKVDKLETECRCGEYYFSRAIDDMAFYQIKYTGIPQSNRYKNLKVFHFRGFVKKYNQAICGATIWAVKQYLSENND